MKTMFAVFGSLGVLIATILSSAAQPTDIRQGLVAYWPLESHDGAVTPDATPFANALTLAGAPTVGAGRFGNAFTFGGASTYLSNLHLADNYPVGGLPIYRAGSYTIAMWVKGSAQSGRYLFSHGNTTTTTPIFILQSGTAANTAKFDVIIRNDASVTLLNHVVSTNVVFDGNWHHIAWVDDRGSVRLYIDGAQDPANFNYTPSGTFTFLNTVIGSLVRTTVATANIFNGQMDDIALWERPLTQVEVQDVMNNSLTTPIPAFPPLILVQPASVTARVGDRLILSTRAIGNRPLSYQWYSNTVEVAGATTASLTLSNLTAADSANYTVQVSNNEGSATSSIATLTVLPDPAPDLRQGLVSYWPLDELVEDNIFVLHTADLYSHNDLTLVNCTLANQIFGRFDNAVSFDGATQYGVRTGGGFPIYNNLAFSVALWVNVNGVGQSDRRFFAESSTNNSNPLFVFGTHTTGIDGTIRVFIRNDTGGLLLDRNSTTVALDGTWHHVVWTETNGQARLYIDGQMDASSFNYTRSALTLNQTALGAIVRATVAAHCAGSLDEVAVWNRPLTFTEIQEIRTTGIPAPIMAIPPTITQDPVSQSVLTPSRVTFSFVATGTSPLFTQWRKGGADLPNETNATLVFESVVLANAGDYDVVVTNSAGSATSQVATLTVTLRPPPPTELRIDFNNIGADDSPANTEPGFQSFSITAFGTGPFTRTFGGGDITLTAIGTTMESRKRATPVNSGAFTEERLLQDFVFTRDAAADQGLDVAVEFMEPNTPYRVSLWSFDTGSTGNNRISDWSVNGVLVSSGWSFIGSTLPVDNNTYRFDFDTSSDLDGKILIQGRRNAGAAGAINVFLNALKVARRELRIQKIEVIGFDLVLTIDALNPAAIHRIDYKNSLNDTDWTEDPLAFFQPPNGNIIQVYVSLPDTSTRFYRVVQVP